MDTREQRVLQIFREALDADDSMRDLFVAQCCADDIALRARVTSLLRRVDGADADDADRQAEDPMLGQMLGPFLVVEKIGRGGMGVVYRGTRVDADFTHEVAIKLIRRGFDFDDVHARFIRERRILARLSHPNLARFIDGGVTAGGRPWFALDYVRGISITAWCDGHRLDIRSRLKLFLDVCAAVQYAHTQLVVHRDLKPGNVLVDETGAVRLLDFGVAGLLESEATDDARPITIARRHAMTPEYAAPEQFAGEPAGVSADVYSLGVLAYELIAGVLPYALDRHDTVASERIVREVPPESLSAAIGYARTPQHHAMTSQITLDQRAALPSANDASRVRLASRRLSLRAYRALVRGDLTRILQKALAKEPVRRYATVQAFADDIGHWLDGAPVRVTGNGLGYRMRKFIARNRSGVALATLALAILAAGTIGVILKSREALREAERATAVQTFLLSLFDSNVPGGAADQVPSTRDLLARGVERVQVEMKRQPLLQADMLTTLGKIHNQLGLTALAEPLLKQAIAVEDLHGASEPLRHADTLLELARTLRRQQRYDDAMNALAQARILVGARDPEREADIRSFHGVLLGLKGNTEQGANELHAALAIRRAQASPDDTRIATDLNDLGFVLDRGGRFEESVVAYQDGLAIYRAQFGEIHEANATSLSNIGNGLRKLGKLEEAEAALRDAVRIDKRVYTQPHPKPATHLSNLAIVILARGDAAEAVRLLRESLALRETLYGKDSAEAAKTLINLGAALVRQESFEDAIDMLQRAQHIFVATKGDWRDLIAFTDQNLARAFVGMKLWRDAEEAAQRAIAMRLQLSGEAGAETLQAKAALGTTYLESGRLAEAQAIFEANLATSLAHLPADGLQLPQRHLELAEAQSALGTFAQARSHYQESLRLGLAALGERNDTMLRARLGLSDALRSLGDTDTARTQLAATSGALALLPAGHSQRLRAERMVALLSK